MGLRAIYRRLPEEVRRCLRPLNLLDESASFFPAPLRAPTVTATEMARRVLHLRHARYPIRHLEGPGLPDGGHLTCVVAADELSTRYWTRTFFASPPLEQTIGVVPALGVRDAAARIAPSADLSLWQVSWPMSRLVPRGATIPASLPFWLDTGRDLEAVILGEPAARGSRREEVRRARRLGLTMRVTSDAADYERFRQELYEPYTRQRFGELRTDVPRHVFRHARRQGWLLLLEQDGRSLAGAVVERWGSDGRALAFGVAREGPIRPTALLAACYYHAIAFAVDKRFRRFSLGTTRPVLADGVLRYKRKWGAAIGRPNTWDAYLLRYRNTPALRAALTAAPLVVDRGGGRLAALVGGTGVAPPTQVESTDTRGLGEIAYLVEEDAPTLDVHPAYAALRVVPPGAVWPPEAATSAAPAPAPLPVGDVDATAASAVERRRQAARRD